MGFLPGAERLQRPLVATPRSIEVSRPLQRVTGQLVQLGRVLIGACPTQGAEPCDELDGRPRCVPPHVLVRGHLAIMLETTRAARRSDPNEDDWPWHFFEACVVKLDDASASCESLPREGAPRQPP